jgi:hypothetical protein
MDLLSRIAACLGENEATISAVVGVVALVGCRSYPARGARHVRRLEMGVTVP